jgi:ribonuclease D
MAYGYRTEAMSVRLHEGDLPEGLDLGPMVAIDTETMGLAVARDRLCVVQMSRGDGSAEVVRIAAGQRAAPRLAAMLGNPQVLKLFHFGRFDMGVLAHTFGVMPAPVYCTKIASKLARTYTDRHGLKDLVKELVGVDLSKQQQSSDWGAASLSEAQLAYAASDVLHLHALRERLDAMLAREGRDGLAKAAFAYLPDRVRLDLAGFEAIDIFAHSSP